jgi:hypothetical protein
MSLSRLNKVVLEKKQSNHETKYAFERDVVLFLVHLSVAVWCRTQIDCFVLQVVSDETTSDSSSEVRNSATEISTDSEFAHDDPTPTREVPFTAFNDVHVTKTRGSGGTRGGAPLRKIQVTSGYLQRPSDKGRAPKAAPKQDIELNLSPLVSSAPSIVRKPAPVLLPRTEGYALNRTQSTGGIAAKVSLELKKKYLLGESYGPGSIQKSGSASTLDTKLKSFHSNITDCQKLLKPAPEVSAAMQTFCSKLNEGPSPIATPQSPVATPQSPKSFDAAVPQVFENEPEGRPRSPVHETSIIVPKIDWTKNKPQSDDSLSTDSVSDGEAPKTPEFNFESIPTVRIDEIPPDSLCVESVAATEPPKSITSEKKTLNQPKLLPELETKDVLPEIHDVLHVRRKLSTEPDTRSVESDADSIAEPATAALTETELSDWARDGAVSDDLGDDDFELNLESRSTKKPKSIDFGEGRADKAIISELEDLDHICGKDEIKNKTIITEALNSVLSKNLDIEFMDTGTETSSDDGVIDSQNGYILFKDEDELAEDSLNPNINDIVEARNEVLKNTGYCFIANEPDNFGGEVVDLKPGDLEQLKAKQNAGDHDEDSLLIVDPGTTTEENTCSDSTVKNLTEISADKERFQNPTENNNFQRKRLEEKLAKLKAEQASRQQSSQNNIDNNVEFDEHCQRLQSRVEFGNVKDSIDIRKSRRKSKDSPQKPDLIQEEKQTPPPSPVAQPAVRTPDVIYKKEAIEKERDVNQRLVQEMVMNKMKAENKSLDKKRRKSRQFELSKSATTDVVSEINHNLDDSNRNSTYSSGSSVYATPDVLLSTLKRSPESEKFSTPLTRPASVHVADAQRDSIKENPSMPDVRTALFADEFRTPVAPPRLKHEEAKRTAEKLKQDAKVRARLLSNEQLGLSPEDKLSKLKEKLAKREEIKVERLESFLHSNEALNRKREETPTRTKSIDEIGGSIRTAEKFCKSDPNLLDTDPKKAKKKNKEKDRERRKSITKLITTFFTKKSPSGNGRGIFSRISPKAKDVSKVTNCPEGHVNSHRIIAIIFIY